MKSPAQAAYEVFSRSFGIDTEQLRKSKTPVFGALPWEDLPGDEQFRWRMTIQAAIDQQQAIAIEAATSLTREVRATLPTITPVETETYRCPDCHASMMRGENHDCKIIQAHNAQRTAKR